jgi:Mor family transcriptional regulator
MKVNYQNQSIRKAKAKDKWIEITDKYNKGWTAIELAEKYNCSRTHIYWILKQVQKIKN